MAQEPENHTLRLLREIRADMAQGFAGMGERFDRIEQRLASMGQALHGETVLGRYVVGEVDERLEALEQRVATIERQIGTEQP